jgi:FKBP-type peptidyl-prolyl cis-trans isomerase
MSNKFSLIAGIVLALLILLGFGYFIFSAQLTNNSSAVSKSSIAASSVDPELLKQLKIEDISTGTGREVKSGDKISINYRGTLLDGKEFDSSLKPGRKPFETVIGVGRVIQGWDIGIVGLKEGGKRKLTIPAELAYGKQSPSADIPANSTLVFEVELLKVL